ncbi:MAG: endolytic transglycosylase MltG [Burkholderiales bacterium]|nr:endolytic transglycosylase MltG [Burkholderiales bacterium]
MMNYRNNQSQNAGRVTKITLLLFIAFAIFFGYIVFFPKIIPNGHYKLTVYRGDSFSKVAYELESNGVVSDAKVLIAIAKISGKDKKTISGVYVLNGAYSLYDLVSRLSNGKPDEISIIIREGWTFKQIRSYLDSESQITHLTESMTDDQIRDRLKIDAPKMEGLLYPNTYFIAPYQSDLEIIQNAYKAMQNRLPKIWNSKNQNAVYKNQYELLIMASLIQKETSNESDMIMVSTVFNNRLRINMRLQDDPAVFYGLGNKNIITRADFAIDTPYNTYLRYGLPPTPICTPSLKALNAAASPAADKSLLYFVAIGKGKTKFSSTYGEHNTAVNKYLKK